MEVTISNKKYENIRSGNIGLSGEYLYKDKNLQININMKGNNTFLNIIVSGIYLNPVHVHVFKNCESIELHPIDKNPCGSITIKPRFNGWTNCVTWHTVLILDNVKPLNDLLNELIDRYDNDTVKSMFMIWIKYPVTCPTRKIKDLIDEVDGLDIEEINWNEIINSYKEEF